MRALLAVDCWMSFHAAHCGWPASAHIIRGIYWPLASDSLRERVEAGESDAKELFQGVTLLTSNNFFRWAKTSGTRRKSS